MAFRVILLVRITWGTLQEVVEAQNHDIKISRSKRQDIEIPRPKHYNSAIPRPKHHMIKISKPNILMMEIPKQKNYQNWDSKIKKSSLYQKQKVNFHYIYKLSLSFFNFGKCRGTGLYFVQVLLFCHLV